MLEIKNLTKIFNKEEGPENIKIALNNLSLLVNEGDFITIIGGNGSGKSTLMNIISGAFPPDEGTIKIDGIDVTNMTEYKRASYVGRVFQDPNMGTAPNMSIIENLEIASRRGKKITLKWGFKKSNERIFKETLSTLNLGLENRLTQKVGLLSGGQRQAITLIMATINKPKVLLLDEHTAALDPKTAKKVMSLTKEIIEKNKLTTLMITHNMRDALAYGNRLIMLDSGKIIVDVSGEEKSKLTIEDLLKKFESANGELTDKLLF